MADDLSSALTLASCFRQLFSSRDTSAASRCRVAPHEQAGNRRDEGPCMNAISRLAPALMLAALTGGAQAATFNLVIRDQHSAALADAVVSLTPVTGATKATTATTATIDQRGLRFVPGVLAVQAGTAVSFPNSDQVRHHVYSFSPAKRFELRLYKDTPTEPLVFDVPGVATIGCNIHDWMIAYVVVVDTPHFASTTAEGRARIDVPEGDYDLRIWHARNRDAEATETPMPERVHIGAAGFTRDVALVVDPPAAEPAQSELEQKFRRFQKTPGDGT
jgi:plastocyanin